MCWCNNWTLLNPHHAGISKSLIAREHKEVILKQQIWKKEKCSNLVNFRGRKVFFLFKWVRILQEIDWYYYDTYVHSPASNNDKDPYEVKYHIRVQCAPPSTLLLVCWVILFSLCLFLGLRFWGCLYFSLFMTLCVMTSYDMRLYVMTSYVLTSYTMMTLFGKTSYARKLYLMTSYVMTSYVMTSYVMRLYVITSYV